jgi:hypothetical protein
MGGDPAAIIIFIKNQKCLDDLWGRFRFGAAIVPHMLDERDDHKVIPIVHHPYDTIPYKWYRFV